MLQVMLLTLEMEREASLGYYELGSFTMFSFVYRTLELVIHYILVSFKFWQTGLYFKFSYVFGNNKITSYLLEIVFIYFI